METEDIKPEVAKVEAAPAVDAKPEVAKVEAAPAVDAKPAAPLGRNGRPIVSRFYAPLLLAGLLVFASGCSTMGGLVDGVTGAPIEKTDSITAYHVGQMILPVASQIAAVVRRVLIGL